MRKLASIQKIEKLEPISGKDRIVLATVEGWQVIVQKDQFIPGEKCVYIEIDSVLPKDNENFKFLEQRGYRIKTLKMGGVYSQGICFPLSILPQRERGYDIGDDVTEILGIKHYDEYKDELALQKQLDSNRTESKELKKKIMKFMFSHKRTRPLALKLFTNATKRERAGFPDFVSKTDETRIQNMPQILERKDIKYSITEKLDGSSCTYALKRNKGFMSLFHPFEFYVCSRNIRVFDKNTFYWQMAKKYDIENVLKNIIDHREWIAIQGECIGEGIQGNMYKMHEKDLYVFNVRIPDWKDEDFQVIMDSLEAKALVEAHGMKFVPILETDYVLPDTVNEMISYASGKSVINPEVMREGLVLRNSKHEISFKAVSNDYLMLKQKAEEKEEAEANAA